MSAESSVIRNYLDWVLSLPWGKKTKVKKDINFAKKVLDDDHYGLEKVKERILEYLAVQSRINKIKVFGRCKHMAGAWEEHPHGSCIWQPCKGLCGFWLVGDALGTWMWGVRRPGFCNMLLSG